MIRFLVMRHTPLRDMSFLKCMLCVSFFQHVAQAQQQEIFLIEADSTWVKEVFYFPLSFAPEITYQGFEEAWFPKAWAEKDSASFWSYVFAWRIETHHEITAIDLEQSLRDYFDGLMSAQSEVPKGVLPPTITLFVKNTQKEKRSSFNGKLQIFDAFSLKAPLVLHTTVEQFFCKEHLTSILLFRFSPKSSEHPIWKKLNEFAISEEIIDEYECH